MHTLDSGGKPSWEETGGTQTTTSHSEVKSFNSLPTDYFLRYATANAQPPVDVSQDISDTSYENVNGTTTIRFTRPRLSTDPNVDMSLDHCLYFLYAYGGNVGNFEDPMSVQQHSPSTRGNFENRICIPDNCTGEGTISFRQLAACMCLFTNDKATHTHRRYSSF